MRSAKNNKQVARSKAFEEAIKLIESLPPVVPMKDAVWVETQRIRRIYQSLMTYTSSGSKFLLEWAQTELMHILRDK